MVPAPRTLLAGLAVTALTGLLAVPLSAAASPATAPAPIGYIYGGSISSGLFTLAVAKDHSLKVVRDTPSQGGDIAGVALLHTKGGMWLYVESGAFGGAGSIYEYAVNRKTGAIKRTKAAPIPALGVFRGNNLFAYDGHAANPAFTSVLWSPVCIGTGCATFGIEGFRANPNTGALQKYQAAQPSRVQAMSVIGDWMALLQDQPKGGLAVSSALINHKTGGLKPVIKGFGLVDGKGNPIGGTDVAAGDGVGIDGLSNNSVAEVGVLTGGTIQETTQAHEGTTLSFIPHALLEGETASPAFGPYLQLIAPNGLNTSGDVDLTASKYGFSGGSEDDPRFPETIFQLGAGVYVGIYLNPIAQATDGVGGKGFAMDKTAKVAGTLSVTSMAGYLQPTATKTTIAVHKNGSKLTVSGTVKGGGAGLTVTVTIYVKKGGKFVAEQHRSAVLTGKRHYSTSLSKPKGATCRATARYGGNAATKSSAGTATFSC
jgi:hypothetical protein